MGGKKLEILQQVTNCLLCNKELTKQQLYEVKRGKQKGYCSKACSSKSQERREERVCINCGNLFLEKPHYLKNTCSMECKNKIHSKYQIGRVLSEDTKKKVSDSLKRIKHKPYLQGGNGRGATKEQLLLYNELTVSNDSFQMEFIVVTNKKNVPFKVPYHYKIDIASKIHMIAIEINGGSHNSQKVKECDERKKLFLNSKGWKVLSFSNKDVLENAEQIASNVLSMI